MRKNILRLCILMACATVCVMTGCKGPKAKDGDTVMILKQADGEPIAQVGNTKLTLEELRDDFLSRQGSFRGSANLNTDKARSDFMESQVMQEAMFKKAVEKGYAERPEVKRQIKKLLVQKLVADELDRAQKEFVATDEQMLDHYNKNQNFYNRPEAVKVAYISVPFTADNKAKVKEIADSMHKDALASVKNNNTREFSRIAMKHAQKLMTASKISVETNETDYLDKAAFEGKFGPNTFDPAKDQSNIGDIRPMVTTTSAFVIMMKTGVRKALNETFEDAKPKIAKRLAYESRNEFYKNFTQSLQAEYKITINKERVAELSKDDKPKMAENGGAPKNEPAQKMPAPQGATTAQQVETEKPKDAHDND